MQMTRTQAEISSLLKQANAQPASELTPHWFFIWIVVSIGLLWIFSSQAFPVHDGAQGVSLEWVGALIVMGGLIATGFCYIQYRIKVARKKAAMDELKELSQTSDQYLLVHNTAKINLKESIFSIVVALIVLGIIVYLVQSFI